MTDLTNREKLTALMNDMEVEQADAMQELHDFLTGEEGQVFRDKLKAVQDRTIPGRVYDQTIGNVGVAIDALSQVAAAAPAMTAPPTFIVPHIAPTVEE